jgi:hypothetical protein
MNDNHHHPTTRSSSTVLNELNEIMKKTVSPRRQTTRSTSILNKDDDLSSTNIQVIKPVAVRPPSSDSTHNSYNLRSRTKLKTSHHTTEVIPSFTEKLSLDTSITQQKPVPPLTRAAAASAGVKIDSFVYDESIKANNNKISLSFQQSTRSSTTRKRKASEDDHRPYLDLLKMKQVISMFCFFLRNNLLSIESHIIIYYRISQGVNVNSSLLFFFLYTHHQSICQ